LGAPRILISHACDDPDWPDAWVIILARHLEALGFAVDLDLLAPPLLRHLGSDTEWQDWMQTSLKAADHVLVLRSALYVQRVDVPTQGQGLSGRGLQFEFTELRNVLYNQRQRNMGRIVVLVAQEAPVLDGLAGNVREFAAHQADDLLQALAAVHGMTPANFEPMPLLATGAAMPAAQGAGHPAVRAYLSERLARHYARHVERYVPLAATEQHTPLAEDEWGDAPFDIGVIVALCERGDRRAPAAEEENRHADVLAAYRALPQRQNPRVAVLGEPGAGKSYSLERLFCELADRALTDPQAPVPLLAELGGWIEEGPNDPPKPFSAFLAQELGQAMAAHWPALRHRAVLLLDGLNELPLTHRETKVSEIRQQLQPEAGWAGVMVSCRERDFTQDLRLPLDTLTLQPLAPEQVHDFLVKRLGREAGQALFWALAAGADEAEAVRQVWHKWAAAGADLALFWQANKVPKQPDVYSHTSGSDNDFWREVRSRYTEPRSLLKLAGNPYWLTLLAMLGRAGGGSLPRSRAQLIQQALYALYRSKPKQTRNGQAVQTAAPRPPEAAWRQALLALALALQQGAAQAMRSGVAPDEDSGSAQTRLPRHQAPASLTDEVLEFAIGVQVLREAHGQLSFTHQLLQETLASQALLEAAQAGQPPASHFWPRLHWWQRNGWEVVAELAGEQLAGDAQAAQRLVAWLAEAQPEVAAAAWAKAESPALPPELREYLRRTWLPGMTDPTLWPRPEARAAIGRAMAGFDLDNRSGVGLRPDGLPDIEWVEFKDGLSFIYQEQKHPGLPPFALARYPVTNRQFQTFVDAEDGYRNARWWQGFKDQQRETPWDAKWPDANSPRENVRWFDAVAFCRWLTHRLGLPPGQVVRLPTEREWERAARGRTGWERPSSHANCHESNEDGGAFLQRTSAVGLYPQGATPEGDLFDMAGNVEEWCADAHDPEDAKKGEFANVERVVRGSSWYDNPAVLRAAFRFHGRPDNWFSVLGFRVCRASPI